MYPTKHSTHCFEPLRSYLYNMKFYDSDHKEININEISPASWEITGANASSEIKFDLVNYIATPINPVDILKIKYAIIELIDPCNTVVWKLSMIIKNPKFILKGSFACDKLSTYEVSAQIYSLNLVSAIL